MAEAAGARGPSKGFAEVGGALTGAATTKSSKAENPGIFTAAGLLVAAGAGAGAGATGGVNLMNGIGAVGAGVEGPNPPKLFGACF